MKTWTNGAKGFIVKEAIDYNFNMLGQYLSHGVLALSTFERINFDAEYLRDGSVVFDTDLKRWLKYSNGSWNDYMFNYSGFVAIITKEDWINGSITIPYTVHNSINPITHLYMLVNDDNYDAVLGGISINNSNDVILTSDLPFEGKVVIK